MQMSNKLVNKSFEKILEIKSYLLSKIDYIHIDFFFLQPFCQFHQLIIKNEKT